MVVEMRIYRLRNDTLLWIDFSGYIEILSKNDVHPSAKLKFEV